MNKGRKSRLAYWGVMEMKGTSKQTKRKKDACSYMG